MVLFNARGVMSEHPSIFFPEYDKKKEVFVFVGPHDDDVDLGCALLMQDLVSKEHEVYVFIASDGSKGYSNAALKDKIVGLRKEETNRAYSVLGVNPQNIIWMDCGDSELESQLYSWNNGEELGFCPSLIQMVRALGQDANVRLFIPNGNDCHIDHQAVYRTSLYAAMQAQEPIWPELGNKAELKTILQYAVWSPFKGEPTHGIRATPEMLERKLESLKCYETQGKLIEGLIENVGARGPYEFFQEFKFESVPISEYAQMFSRTG